MAFLAVGVYTDYRMWAAIGTIISVASVVVACTAWLNKTLTRIEHRLDQVDLRLSTVEHQIRALLKAFPQVISSLITGQVVSSAQGIQIVAAALEAAPLPDFIRNIKPTTNPLSQADLDRMRAYTERLKAGSWLSPQEAQDFYRIADVITREYPANEGSWLLFLIGGILLGAILSKK